MVLFTMITFIASLVIILVITIITCIGCYQVCGKIHYVCCGFTTVHLAHCYAIFLCSLDVEIDDSLVGQLTTVHLL